MGLLTLHARAGAGSSQGGEAGSSARRRRSTPAMAECRTPPRARTAPAVILMLTLPLPLPPPPLMSALLTAPRTSFPSSEGACRAACRLAIATGVSGSVPATAPFPIGATVATLPAGPFGTGDGKLGDVAEGSAECVPLAADSSARRFCRERCTSWNRANIAALSPAQSSVEAFVDNVLLRRLRIRLGIIAACMESSVTAPYDTHMMGTAPYDTHMMGTAHDSCIAGSTASTAVAAWHTWVMPFILALPGLHTRGRVRSDAACCAGWWARICPVGSVGQAGVQRRCGKRRCAGAATARSGRRRLQGGRRRRDCCTGTIWRLGCAATCAATAASLGQCVKW